MAGETAPTWSSGTLGAVEVPVGQLAQGVGSSPGGRAQILPSPRPELGIHHGLEGGEHSLSTLRIKLSLHPDHPGRSGAHVEAAPISEHLGSFQDGPFIDTLRPVTNHPAEFLYWASHGGLEQRFLSRPEFIRVLSLSLCQDPDRTRGHRSCPKGFSDLGGISSRARATRTCSFAEPAATLNRFCQ